MAPYRSVRKLVCFPQSLETNMGTMPPINWLAVLAATVAAFLLGGLWFSKVMFAKQ